MNRLFYRYLHVLALLSPLALTLPAAAQDVTTAEALFDRGLAEMQAGHYETGCKAIAESYRLDARPGTLFTLAVCESQWDRVATAAARFDQYLQVYARLTPEQQARQGDRPKVAEEQRRVLLPEIPELLLLLPPGAPAATVVKRDSEVLGPASLGVALPVDPGEHVVSTQAPGGPVWEQRITLAKGEKKHVTLVVKAPPSEVAKPHANMSRPALGSAEAKGKVSENGDTSRGWRTAAYTVGGVGLTGVVAGGILGGLALGKNAALSEHCGSAIGSNDPTACDTIGFEAAQSLKTLGIGSTIGVGLGLAGIATATVLLVTAPKPAQPRNGASARWIRASIISARSDGAFLGVQGKW